MSDEILPGGLRPNGGESEPFAISFYSATRVGAFMSLAKRLEIVGMSDRIGDIECRIMTNGKFKYVARLALHGNPNPEDDQHETAQRRVA